MDGLTKRPNHDSKLRSPLLATKSFSAESKNRVISDTGSKDPDREVLMFLMRGIPTSSRTPGKSAEASRSNLKGPISLDRKQGNADTGASLI